MSGHKTRIRTIQALLAGCPAVSAIPTQPIIQDEFNEVYAVRRIRKDSRRRLLEVLHSARGLDTVLKTFVHHHGCSSKKIPLPTAMGSYLLVLRDHSIAGLGQITETERSLFQSRIVNTRNTYLHEAGAFPSNDHDVNVLLSDMHSCIATVIAL